MRVARNTLAVFLSLCLGLPVAARAQQPSVIDRAAVDRAVAAHADRADADRQAIRCMLERDQVRQIAARAGIDLKRAEHAVATLNGAELRDIAEQARAVDNSLAGGGSITISTTTIIIGLLVLILLIVALK